MKSRKFKLAAAAVAAVMLVGACGMFTACGDNKEPEEENPTDVYSLDFTEQVKKWELKSYAKANISYYTASAYYCEKPTHPGNQSLALYVPQAYINDDGKTFNTTATVNGYNVNTAPIIYWNSHGSYIGMGPFSLTGLSTRTTEYGWAIQLLNQGFIVCMVGERGKTSTDSNDKVIGRGPVAISDLKAGVRFLKHNDDVIPGSSDRIVSVGTSSGGAMSALLGASGNNDYYDTYLEEMGAYVGADADDSIFATMAYCPITDLPHADYAYEWMFNQDTTTFEMDEFQELLSDELAKAYAEYVNGFELKDSDGNPLTLAADGSKSGTYYDWLVSKYEESFEDYAKNYESDYKGKTKNSGQGAVDAESLDWLEYDSATGKATLVTPDGYSSALDAMVLTGFRARGKNVLAFDSFAPVGGDNELFGEQGTAANAAASARHYSMGVTEIIGKLKEQYPDKYATFNTATMEANSLTKDIYEAYQENSSDEEVAEWAIYTNAYSFLTGAAESDVSPNFRINMGALDADTSITVSATLSLLLEKAGVNTEFNIMWDWGHNDCDTPTGLADWVNSICK